ncbi:MAG: hypothetical protein LC657_10650, partial [Desulfobacteraceae bacterium]|nr:hypothetical protein [Desulfobacteraceae bacterium]
MTESKKHFFDHNLSLLEKNHAHLAAVVAQKKDDLQKTQIVHAHNGKPNIQVETGEGKQVMIHDINDPGIESEAFLSLVPEDSTGTVLMFGMGLGYSVIRLLENRPCIPFLFVFEADIDLFVQAMHAVDLSGVLTDKRVKICLGEPADLPAFMAPANRALMLENIHTLNLLSCFQANPVYETVSSRVFTHINALNTE